MCDAFDNLCHDESGKRRALAAALYELQSPAMRSRFDPVILRGLLRHVPPFSLGMQVTLSDHRVGAVISLNPELPCRPIVRLLHKRAGSNVDIDLAENQRLWVAKAQGCNVEDFYYELPPMPAKVAVG